MTKEKIAMQTKKMVWKTWRTVALGLGAASVLAAPIVSEVRLRSATQPLTNAWQHMLIEPRTATLLGVSFRPPRASTLSQASHAPAY